MKLMEVINQNKNFKGTFKKYVDTLNNEMWKGDSPTTISYEKVRKEDEVYLEFRLNEDVKMGIRFYKVKLQYVEELHYVRMHIRFVNDIGKAMKYMTNETDLAIAYEMAHKFYGQYIGNQVEGRIFSFGVINESEELKKVLDKFFENYAFTDEDVCYVNGRVLFGTGDVFKEYKSRVGFQKMLLNLSKEEMPEKIAFSYKSELVNGLDPSKIAVLNYAYKLNLFVYVGGMDTPEGHYSYILEDANGEEIERGIQKYTNAEEFLDYVEKKFLTYKIHSIVVKNEYEEMFGFLGKEVCSFYGEGIIRKMRRIFDIRDEEKLKEKVKEANDNGDFGELKKRRLIMQCEDEEGNEKSVKIRGYFMRVNEVLCEIVLALKDDESKLLGVARIKSIDDIDMRDKYLSESYNFLHE